MHDYDHIKTRVAELVSQRDRTGKTPLTSEERIQMLNEIYDGLLFFWKQCVLTGNQKGTGSICNQIERARLELESWAGSNKVSSSKIILEFRKPDDEITA